MNGYDLSRAWFDFAFENPDKIRPTHTALYFWCIELCNRLGWKEKFGLPTDTAKDAIGVKNYKTYIQTLNDLVEWGFVKMIQKSQNQYTSNIVALVKNNKATTKALTKALLRQLPKHVQSTVSVDKPINSTTSNQEPLYIKIAGKKFFKKPSEWLSENKKQAVSHFLKGTTKKIATDKVVSAFNSEYAQYEFKDANHVFNAFKRCYKNLERELSKPHRVPVNQNKREHNRYLIKSGSKEKYIRELEETYEWTNKKELATDYSYSDAVGLQAHLKKELKESVLIIGKE